MSFRKEGTFFKLFYWRSMSVGKKGLFLSSSTDVDLHTISSMEVDLHTCSSV